MNYSIYKLKFSAPVHFGKNQLSDSEFSLCSDAVFSALCLEAVRMGEGILDELISIARTDGIQISDALPYIGDKYLLPKPHVFVEHGKNEDSSIIKKAFKKLKYITIDNFESYINGSFDVLNAVELSELGVSSLKISASVRNEEGETMPYEIGTYSFNEGSGLFLIVGHSEEKAKALMNSLMNQLQHSGLGGKRSSGYGRFSYEIIEPDSWIVTRLDCDAERYMLLNTALPNESEMADVVQTANYSLVKRSGFVASQSYSDTWQRKKDLVMFKAGSCFDRRFKGDIYDVSTDAGKHPVFRYGKPMLMRIS